MTAPALRSDAAANRDRIIQAARSVFIERGLDAEMKEIADRASVGVGTIYRNFATKDDLVEAMISSCMAEALVMIRAAREISDVRHRIEELLSVCWTASEQFGPLVRAVGGPGPHPLHAAGEAKGHAPDHEAELIAYWREIASGAPREAGAATHPAFEMMDCLLEAFVEGKAAGIVRPELDPAFVAQYLTTHFAVYLTLRQLHPEATVRRHLTDLFLRAVLVDACR